MFLYVSPPLSFFVLFCFVLFVKRWGIWRFSYEGREANIRVGRPRVGGD